MDRMERKNTRFFRCLQIQILADLAADSFGCGRISIPKNSPERALKKYAKYTVSCMETQEADPDRLFRDAARLGAKIRRLSGLTDKRDLQRLVFLLYRNIYITMKGELPGEISVTDCYFSRIYSPEQCRLMSFVDSGIISGIFGGGRLRFSQRITEGCECCMAAFSKEIRKRVE